MEAVAAVSPLKRIRLDGGDKVIAVSKVEDRNQPVPYRVSSNFVPLNEVQVKTEIDKLFDMEGVVAGEKIGVPPPLLKQASEPGSSILLGVPFEYQLLLPSVSCLVTDDEEDGESTIILPIDEMEEEPQAVAGEITDMSNDHGTIKTENNITAGKHATTPVSAA